MDWERYNRNKAARLAKKLNINRNTDLRKNINELKKRRKPKEKLHAAPLHDSVTTIYWVKDTPKSLAIAFLEWKNAQQR